MDQAAAFGQMLIGMQSCRSQGTPSDSRPTHCLPLAGAIAFASFAAAFIVAPAGAASPPRSNPNAPCAPEVSSSRTITALSGPASLRLDDAAEIVIAGLLLPGRIDNPGAATGWAPARRAAAVLEHLVLGRSAELAPARHKFADRYGRRHTHVYIQAADRRIWLQASLVGLGHARVDVERLTAPCATELLRHEAEARRARRGLWSDAAYQIRDARKNWTLLRYRSTFQIVRGTVHRVTRVRSRVFINFGRNWRKDFTAGLTRKLARRIAHPGKGLADLQGRRVLVRGWIERRGGPYIAIRSPAQIQLADGHAGTPDQPPHHTPPGRPTKRRPAVVGPDALDL